MSQSYVSLRSQYGAGRIDRRRYSPQPGSRARHDSAQTSWAGQVARTQPDVRRVSEVFRRDAEAGEGNSEAVGGLSTRGDSRPRLSGRSSPPAFLPMSLQRNP